MKNNQAITICWPEIKRKKKKTLSYANNNIILL